MNKDIIKKINSFINHPGIKKYAKNTVWMFIESITRFITGFIISIWITRYLGPEKFGIYSYTLAYTYLFSGITNLGIDTAIVVREILKHPQNVTEILGTAFKLKLSGALITIFIIIISLFFTDNKMTQNIYILIVSITFIFQAFGVIEAYFQSQVKAKYVSLAKIIQMFISSTIKISLIVVKADLNAFIVMVLLEQIILAILISISYKKNGNGNFYEKFNIDIAKELLKYSWPLLISAIATSIYMRIDQVMIAKMINERELGIYSAAVRLVEIWYFIPTILSASLLPAIINTKLKNTEKYEKRMKYFYKLNIITSLIITVIIILSSHKLTKFLYGNKYIGTEEILNIYIFSFIFVSIGISSYQWIITENLQRLFTINTILGAIVRIFSNIILIKKYGIKGAAYATVLSYFVSSYLGLLLWNKTRKNFWLITKSIFSI